jgi:hypothetical protein
VTGATITEEWDANPHDEPKLFIRRMSDGTWETGTAGRAPGDYYPGQSRRISPLQAFQFFRGTWGYLPGNARDLLAEELVLWSVTRSTQNGLSYAVEPGAEGVSIPDDVLTWAEGHGLSADDPDVYLLVAPLDEARGVLGEIACMWGELPAGEISTIRAALAEALGEKGLEAWQQGT